MPGCWCKGLCKLPQNRSRCRETHAWMLVQRALQAATKQVWVQGKTCLDADAEGSASCYKAGLGAGKHMPGCWCKGLCKLLQSRPGCREAHAWMLVQRALQTATKQVKVQGNTCLDAGAKGSASCYKAGLGAGKHMPRCWYKGLCKLPQNRSRCRETHAWMLVQRALQAATKQV